MKLSQYFQELQSVYDAELEDLTSDSEGKDILRHRLKEKREQVPFLLPMMKSNPEMVAVAFHDAFKYLNPLKIELLLSKPLQQLTPWAELSKHLRLEAWAESLSKTVLQHADGEQFMVIAAALEYLNKSKLSRASSPSVADDDQDDESEHEDDGVHDVHGVRNDMDDGDSEDGYDLEEAGADFLAEQGFDRKD
ncbi:hypothetical protein ACO0K3_08450 [Undibacterium sp. Rencai35W]|uniref:hypothetical protein n=1 Tax=Undibacterium sp. Rencai35W TaxID=3413046 RepID=UPI003BF18B2A